MATPLGELLRQLRTDTDVQIRFHQSPAEYLHEHGWGDLDAADVHEAMLLLADAAPAAEASGWIAAGDAIDPDAGDAAAALGSAIGTFGDLGATADRFDDVADLDEFDGIGESDPGELDGIAGIDSGTADQSTEGDPSPAVIASHESSVGTMGEPSTSTPTSTEPGIEIDALDLDADVDPTDAPSPTDTPLTEDHVDTTVADLDPDPDWDDPS